MTNKYRNKKVIIDGVKFDSMAEGKRYQELKLLERAGHISHLSLQPQHTLQASYTDAQGVKHRAITYKADFRYWDADKQVMIIEDVKGVLTDVYKIKKKLLCKILPKDVVFREITL